MEKKFRNKRKRKLIKPATSDEVHEAIEEFLNNGGKITKVEQLHYQGFMEIKNTSNEGDDFLMGV